MWEMCEHQAGLPGASLKVSIFVILIIIFFNNFLFYSWFLAYTRCIALKQWCVSYTNTNILAIILTYGRILSAIEKVLRELIEEYQGVGKSL